MGRKRGTIMERKILIGIILVLIVFVVMGFGCQRKPISVSMEEELSIYPLYDLSSALASGKIEIINEEVFIKLAKVKEISGGNLTIKVFDIGKGREEAFYLLVPANQRFPGIKGGDFIEIHLDLNPDNTIKEIRWLLMG